MTLKFTTIYFKYFKNKQTAFKFRKQVSTKKKCSLKTEIRKEKQEIDNH